LHPKEWIPYNDNRQDCRLIDSFQGHGGVMQSFAFGPVFAPRNLPGFLYTENVVGQVSFQGVGSGVEHSGGCDVSFRLGYGVAEGLTCFKT
jgi:hypothetical protein